MGDVLSGELKNSKKWRASHLSEQVQNGLNPNPYHKQKERTNRFIAEMSSLFSVCMK